MLFRSSEDEGVDVEDYELIECMKGLASIMSKSNSLGRSFGRGRGRNFCTGIQLF